MTNNMDLIDDIISFLTEEERTSLLAISDSSGFSPLDSQIGRSLEKKGLIENLPSGKGDFTDLGEAVCDRLLAATAAVSN
jgi:hypothetical protein